MLIAVDTGGTKTLVTSFTNGTPGERLRFPTPKDPRKYIEKLTETISSHYDTNEISGISIAVPGIVKDNIAIWCGNLDWHNFDIAKDIKQHLNVPVWIENDANLAGLAQAHALSPLPEKCLYITVSTGIGTGFIHNGAIEPQLSNSEGGRMVLEFNGQYQQWEHFGSGRAFYETYGKFARDVHDDDTWEEYVYQRLGCGFLAIIPLTQPDTIVIGGSIGSYFDRYSMYLERFLKEKLSEHIIFPKIVQAFHPEEAVIYGCYQYASENPSAAT